MLNNRKEIVFTILSGLFITNAIVAELIGGKLINIAGFTLSMGILPWPIVFIVTDLINEYFGKQGVKKLTFITAALICYAFVILFFAIRMPASPISPVSAEAFAQVFSQSLLIIIGSIVAFVVSQLLDATIFNYFKTQTQYQFIWLRATGSTAISQLIDTFIVAGIAFYLPGLIAPHLYAVMSFENYVIMCFTGYIFKLGIAVILTPLIYASHFAIKKYLNNT